MINNNKVCILLGVYLFLPHIAFGMNQPFVHFWDKDGVHTITEQLMEPAKQTPKTKYPVSLYEHFGLSDCFEQAPIDIKSLLLKEVMGDRQWWYGTTKIFHKEPVTVVRYSPSGNVLATCSQDKTVCFWNKEGRNKKTIRFADCIRALAFHPKCKQLLVAVGKKVILLDSDGKQVREFVTFAQKFHRVAFNPQGTLCVVVAPYTQQFFSLEDHNTWGVRDDIDCRKDLAVHPEGLIAAIARARYVQICDLISKNMDTMQLAHDATVHAVAFQPQGHLLVTGCDDGSITVWNMAWEKEKTFVADDVKAIEFHPQGKLLALLQQSKGLVTLCDKEGYTVAQLKHNCGIQGFSFHPQGDRLAVACQNNSVNIWQHHTPTFEQMLLRLVLKQYMCKCIAARRRPGRPESQSPKDFIDWMAPWFNLEKKKLQKVWATFSDALKKSIVRSYIDRADTVAKVEQQIADNERWQKEYAARKKY